MEIKEIFIQFSKLNVEDRLAI